MIIIRTTPYQRLTIRTQLAAIELPTDFIGIPHVRVFVAAGLPAPTVGARLEDVLVPMEREAAKKLIESLSKKPQQLLGA